MTIEKFLSFWDHHNTSIIEGLLGLIILLALFLAFRAFFAKKGSSSTTAENGQGIDAAQLEKTLQKILDNQSHAPAAKSRPAAEDLGVDVEMDESPLSTKKAQASAASSSADAAAAVAESAAEVAQLRLSLSENHQKVETLQAQLQEALAAAQAASAGGGAGGGGEGGMSSAEKEELNGKLRDLEARLAEYEIISEDIADLSRYRDENEDLKKQLEALKAGAPAPAAAAPAPEAAPAPAPEPTPEPAAPAAEVAAEPAPEAPADSGGGSDLIDDDLMKEFAAAVEGQRALDKAAEKAGDGSEEAAKNGDETNQLMSEFENFVTKKS
ncbi:hypothetical protein [Bdellovibrio bacteriovorus]|uniref:Uncharacterized protein n=1 Tax=Bdellovibrio bacteriovorus TaxID=959 RepID=A0A1Z3N6P9_BDEBC|nr:hypothetical protein [Bdellovibrio bacteriovorus]ASD63126.1 hypothetical protein B9G79_05855 [Bdellovibrio bacteriovorus]